MNCQKGDLAVMFRVSEAVKQVAPRLAENIGAFVDILELDAAVTAALGTPYWQCKTRNAIIVASPLLIAFGIVKYDTAPAGSTVSMPDEYLKPIRPGKEPEKITTPEDLGCFTV